MHGHMDPRMALQHHGDELIGMHSQRTAGQTWYWFGAMYTLADSNFNQAAGAGSVVSRAYAVTLAHAMIMLVRSCSEKHCTIGVLNNVRSFCCRA